MKLKIAFLQLMPGAAIEDNIEKGIKACREAKEKGADIALFPEMWSSGYVFPHDEEWLKKNSVSLDSAYVKRFSGLARELQMAIAITLLEKYEPNPRNTVCLFDRHGKLVYRYSKVHICNFGEEDDESLLDAGDNFCVEDLDTEKGLIKVGSMICYDREFPEAARVLMMKGAELLLVPNACPMEINRLSQLRGRAYENQLAIATCNYPAGSETGWSESGYEKACGEIFPRHASASRHCPGHHGGAEASDSGRALQRPGQKWRGGDPFPPSGTEKRRKDHPSGQPQRGRHPDSLRSGV